MKDSIRRVFSATGIIGLLAFSIVTLQQIAQSCASGQTSCLTAAVTFGIPETTVPTTEMLMSHTVTTDATTEFVPSVVSFIFTLIQVTSVYLILISVMVLVFLEFMELRYLRALMSNKHA